MDCPAVVSELVTIPTEASGQSCSHAVLSQNHYVNSGNTGNTKLIKLQGYFKYLEAIQSNIYSLEP